MAVYKNSSKKPGFLESANSSQQRAGALIKQQKHRVLIEQLYAEVYTRRMSTPFNLHIGKGLGRHYRVLEFLGNGWEGEVYKVEERQTKVIRAAKLFYKKRAQLKSRTQAAPHIHYAQKLNKLRACPIVIQYHHQDSAFIQKQAVEFLVSEFIDGMVLAQYLEKQPGKRLRLFEALHLFYALVKGVADMHQLGEYHGDIHQGNIMIKPQGLGFRVHLIDLYHLGRSTKEKIQQDVYNLIGVFYEMIGGSKYYRQMPAHIKKMVLGRKHSLINKHFNSAHDLQLFLERLEW